MEPKYEEYEDDIERKCVFSLIKTSALYFLYEI